jgi:SAM-dependent methyltransferase
MPVNTFIDNCLCCLNKVESVLNLGKNPLANDFTKYCKNDSYPLELMVCDKCWHCQLHYIVDPDILFRNYKYTSGTSQTGQEFFKKNAENINNNFSGKRILDIACNDGSQLNFFKELGWETYGVDPAENLLPISTAAGHTVICDFWNTTVAMKLPLMDVILAQNVFAHTQDIDLFLQSCKLVMDSNSVLFIQTSQKNMILNSEFDTIYHEHISFFNTNSMDTLVRRNGLLLGNVSEADIHGTSYIFEIRKMRYNNYNVDSVLLKEKELGLYSMETYKSFERTAKEISNKLKHEICEYNKSGYKCIGFGASAKGQTVLCYSEIHLDYIVDENPLKIGLFSPKMNIPIKSFEDFKLEKESKLLIVILAWNFADEIIRKIKSVFDKNVVIIKKYFPELDVIIL